MKLLPDEMWIDLGEDDLVKVYNKITKAVKIKMAPSDKMKVFVRKDSYVKGEKVEKEFEVGSGYVLNPNKLVTIEKRECWLAAIFTDIVDLKPIHFKGFYMPTFVNKENGEKRKIEATLRLKYEVNEKDYSIILRKAGTKNLRKDFLEANHKDDLRLFVKSCFPESLIIKKLNCEDDIKALEKDTEWQNGIRDKMNKTSFISKIGIFISYLNIELSCSRECLSEDEQDSNKTTREDNRRWKEYKNKKEDTIHDEDITDIKAGRKRIRIFHDAELQAYLTSKFNFKAEFRKNIAQNSDELIKLLKCFRNRKELSGYLINDNYANNDKFQDLLYELLLDDNDFRREATRASRELKMILTPKRKLKLG